MNKLKFTELEKEVIRGWVALITTNSFQKPFDPKTWENEMHSAMSYWAVEAYELAEASEIPIKKLRGVLSSLVKKKVFYEDEIEGDTWTSPNKPAFFANSYFCADNYLGDQQTDANIDKINDAIK